MKWLGWIAFGIRLIAGVFIAIGLVLFYPLGWEKGFHWLKEWIEGPLAE